MLTNYMIFVLWSFIYDKSQNRRLVTAAQGCDTSEDQQEVQVAVREFWEELLVPHMV